MDTLFISLLVVHICAAATWTGGAITQELVFGPRLDAISKIQATLVSRKVEVRFTVMSWASLVVISATGVTMSVLQGTFNLHTLLAYPGVFLLASIILTIFAVAGGLLITYYTPRLQSVKAEETNLRGLVKTFIKFNNYVSIAAVLLMVVFTELIRVQG